MADKVDRVSQRLSQQSDRHAKPPMHQRAQGFALKSLRARLNHLDAKVARMDRSGRKAGRQRDALSMTDAASATTLDALQDIRRELSAQLAFGFHDLAQQIARSSPAGIEIGGRGEPEPAARHRAPADTQPYRGIRGFPRRIARLFRRLKTLLSVQEELTGLGNQLASLPELLASLNTHLVQVGSRVDHTEDRIASLAGKLETELDNAFGRYNKAISAELVPMDQRLDAIGEGQNATRAEIGALALRLQEAMHPLNIEINGLRSELASVRDVGADVQDVLSRLAQANEIQLDKLQGDIVARIQDEQSETKGLIGNLADSVQEELTGLGNQLASLPELLASLNTRLAQVGSRVDHTEDRISSLAGKLETELDNAFGRYNKAISAELVPMDQRLDAIGEGQNATRAEIGALALRLQGAIAELVPMDQRLDAIGEGQNAMRAEIGVLALRLQEAMHPLSLEINGLRSELASVRDVGAGVQDVLSRLTQANEIQLDKLQSDIVARIQDERSETKELIGNLAGSVLVPLEALKDEFHIQLTKIRENLQEDLKAITDQFSRLKDEQFETKSYTISLASRTHTRLNELHTEIGERIDGAVRDLLEHLQANLSAGLGADTNACLVQLEKGIADGFGRVQNGQAETRNALLQLTADSKAGFAQLNSEVNISASDRLVDVQSSLDRLSDEVTRLANEQFETKNGMSHLGSSTTAQLNSLTTTGIETKNATIHLNTSLNSRLNAIENTSIETKNATTHLNTSLHSRLNTIENDRLNDLYEQMHGLTAVLLRLRADVEAKTERSPIAPGMFAPASHHGLSTHLQRAQEEFPRIYPLWAERLNETRSAFLETKIGNAARAGDSRSEAFRSFVEIHALGRVLDVGCGVFGRPHYLRSYPADLISGIDPLEPVNAPDFEFVQGLQEYLPWPDGSFSTVVSATSLDHCLSLDHSLAEIRRVLHPGGRFLLWFDSMPGAAPYAPDDPAFTPADRFHLFHFDAAWFEPLLERWFDTVDRIELHGPVFNRVMCYLKLREPEPSGQ